MSSSIQRFLLGDECGSNPTLKLATGLLVVTTSCGGIAGLLLLWWFKETSITHKAVPEACRKLGLMGQSNLADEHDARYLGVTEDYCATALKVKSLWIYPVKSCKGIELQKGTVLGTGMEYDRRFSFARYIQTSKSGEPEHWQWRFITQRDVPMMATIKTELWLPDPSSPAYSTEHPNIQSAGVLIIKYPVSGGKEKQVSLPYDPTDRQIEQAGYQVQSMSIWRDSPESIIIASTETDCVWMQEIRNHLSVSAPLALFRVTSMESRQLFRNAPRKESLGYQPTVGFQDAYPLHFLGLASVLDVASKCDGNPTMLSARNFRANIIVTGGEAYTEDTWKRVLVGNDEYHVSCRTVRCLLPNVSQDTGERRSQPNKALKSFRCVDQGDPKNACLGVQVVPASAGRRTIHVGDEIQVLETGEHLYIKI